MPRPKFAPLRCRRTSLPCQLAGIVLALAAGTLAAAEPEVLDPRLELELVAMHPQIVTPTGLAFDALGRLLVIECHTHFRPEDYVGPAKDRILLFDDPGRDGQTKSPRTFFAGTDATMGLAPGPDGWIYVATRAQIFRLRDRDGDGQAEEREDVVRLDTTGSYPHNGLSGMAFDGEGTLFIGLGENIGEPYELVGQEERRVRGGGEGGSIFRCTAEGRELMRLATGFWNPFGICFDPAGRIFTVDNDPDESPPCRLLHVVPSGDYGYQFRYGRSGRHALQAWNGELPGTLPMVAGTGEAPCDVVALAGSLWVTSWGENRIERFELEPAGASFRARRTIVVQGDQDFRPVDFALGPDNSLYFTDWVDRSYPVHREGRIWKLSWRNATAPSGQFPPLSPAEQRPAALQAAPQLEALDDADPFVRQAAVWGLAQQADLARQTWQDLPSAGRRLGMLEALRWQARDAEPFDAAATAAILKQALDDRDASVRLFAVRWAADERRADLREDIERQLHRADIDERLLLATLAALDWLEVGADSKGDSQQRRLLELLDNSERSPQLRALALRLIPSDRLTVERLRQLAAAGASPLDREAARSLALSALPGAAEAVAELVSQAALPPELRADLALGLANRGGHAGSLAQLAEDPAPCVQQAARRLTAVHGSAAARIDAARPAVDDLDAWLQLVGEGGDADAGWRVFFSSRGAACGACHVFQGRGGLGPEAAQVGPDLTLVGQQLSRRRLLESILQPSREMAPQYVPSLIELADGQARSGLSLERFDDERKERFVGSDGRLFELDAAAIVHRRAAEASIMPEGLEKLLTVDELRDLLALLSTAAPSGSK